MVRKLSKSYLIMIVTVLSLMLTFMMGMTAFASTNTSVSSEAAHDDLTTDVWTAFAGKSFELEGGGYVEGQDLFDDIGNGYDLNENQFSKLSSSAQQEVVNLIAEESNKSIGSDGVTEDTVTAWWKQLQTKEGVGSKFLNEILKNTKPDFVTANQIFEPFSGPISTVIGIIAVVMMSLLGVVMVADIAYITLPPVRLLVEDKDNGGKPKSKIFSYDAVNAVRIAEEQSTGEKSEGKQALGIYFKRRIFMLILLGICLLYLVQGQIYTLVGYILDLVSGFLGF